MQSAVVVELRTGKHVMDTSKICPCSCIKDDFRKYLPFLYGIYRPEKSLYSLKKYMSWMATTANLDF